MNTLTRKANTLMRGALKRLSEGEAWEKLDEGKGVVINVPDRMEATALLVLKAPRNPSVSLARKLGAEAAKFAGKEAMTLLLATQAKAEELLNGLVLRAYSFDRHKSEPKEVAGKAAVMANGAEALEAKFAPLAAVAAGVHFTRDLVNEPANVLTTTEFANRLVALKKLGVKVEVLEEAALEKLGMGSLLCVGFGSESPSKVVVMQWQGGGEEQMILSAYP